MKQNSLRELWRDTVPPEVPCPEADAEAVLRRVNAVLDTVPSERKIHMGRKIRFAAVFAAVTVLLAGAALGVAAHWDVLNAFFQGDTSPAEELVDREVRAISDKDYTLTVESSVSDGTSALLLVRLTALTEEAKSFLFSDAFNNIDTWSIRPLYLDGNTPASGGMTYWEMGELRTEDSTVWAFDVSLNGADRLRVRMGYMEEGASLEFSLSPAEPVTVEIHATGKGIPALYNAKGGSVTLESVTLSPLTCQIIVHRSGTEPKTDPLLFFLQADGTLLGSGETLTSVSESWETGVGTYVYRFQQVMDLSQLEAVVFDGIAYPLDGGEPYAVEVDPKLYPFQLPLMDRLSEGAGYSLPVQTLCGALGADYSWDQEIQAAVCAYRGTTISLTVGSTTALVNGQEVALEDAPALQDGVLVAGFQVFGDAWGLDSLCPFNEDWTERVCWVIIP